MPSAAPSATSADVAAIIPERVGSTGDDFTVDTTPTKAQVDLLISQIVVEVQAVAGELIDSRLAAYATLVVATGVAAHVELGFTSDVPRDTETKYEWLLARYREMLATLDRAQTAASSGELGGEVAELWATFPDLTDPAQVGPSGYTTWGERW